MKLLVYYSANLKRFDVIYDAKRMRHRNSPDTDKYNRMFIQEINLISKNKKGLKYQISKVFNR